MAKRVYSTSATAPAAFAAVTAPDFTIPFVPSSIVIVNEDSTTANYVEVSFDGTSVACRLIPGLPTAAMRFELRKTKIWLRRGAGTPTVRITAED